MKTYTYKSKSRVINKTNNAKRKQKPEISENFKKINLPPTFSVYCAETLAAGSQQPIIGKQLGCGIHNEYVREVVEKKHISNVPAALWSTG